MGKRVLRLLLFFVFVFGGIYYCETGSHMSVVEAADEYATRDAYYDLADTTVNRMTSEHFQIIWGNGDTTGTVNEEFVRGNLINLETIRSFYMDELGFADLGNSQNKAITGKYKTNVYIAATGLSQIGDDWAYMTIDKDAFAYLVMAPGAMRVDPPSWVVPHELAHAFTYHMGGVVPYEWYEAVANFCRNKYLQSSYNRYGNNVYGPETDFFAPFILNAESHFPHTKNWYDVWPIFLYIEENPDQIPGLGHDAILKMLSNNREDETFFHTIERVTGVEIQKILGGFERRLVTMDFDAQSNYQRSLNDLLRQDSSNYGKIYTTLEKAEDGWMSVPDSKAPQQGGYNIVLLDTDLSKDSIEVEFEGLSLASEAGWRSSIVTVTRTGETRYSTMWESGVNSIKLRGDETAAYLVVSATPSAMKKLGLDTDGEKYPYRVKVTSKDMAQKQTLAQFDFDDEATGFSGGNAVASGEHSLMTHGSGNALYLDGTNDFLTVTSKDGNSLLSGLQEMTISFEAKPEAGPFNWLFYAAPDAGVQEFFKEKYVGILDNGSIVAERYKNTTGRPDVARAEKEGDDWYYLTVVQTREETIIYVDGEEKARQSSEYALSDILGDNSILYIGKANWNEGEYYKGLIDNYSIMNYAQSAEEVKSAYAKRTIPEVLADFKFDADGSYFDGGNAKAAGTYTLEEHGTGKALKLDGNGQHLVVTGKDGSSLLTGVDEMTVSYQIKPENSRTNWGFFAAPDENQQKYQQEHYAGIVDISGTTSAERYNNSGARPATASAVTGYDGWYYVTAVYSERATTLYVNGKKVAEEASDYALSDILGENSILYIGKSTWESGEYATALIDNYKIVSRALTAEEVAEEAAKYVEAAPVQVDKTDLKTAIDTKVDAKDTYTDASWKVYADALAKADEVYKSDAAAQTEVDAAAKALTDAIKKLEKKPAVVTVDKKALQEAIKNAVPVKDEDQYTADSWKVYEDALAKANEVNADTDATQAEVNAATKALTDAQAALEKKPEDPKPVEKELPYVDVAKGDWFYDGVYYNYFAGTMTGKDETHFAPLENLARAQFAVIIHRMNGEPKVEYKPTFPDVADHVWYTDAILWAASTGVVTGYTDTGMFGPADNINREQMAVMMYRYANDLGYDTVRKADFGSFEDAASVSAYANDAMRWAVGNGIITGKYNGTQIDPQGNALRGECALIIQRFMEKYEEK